MNQDVDYACELIENWDPKKQFILDACCGPKFMWFDKHHPNTIYIDIRSEQKGFVEARKNVEIQPDMIADFRDLPFPDKSFRLVAWDPPHIIRKNYAKHDMTLKYGILDKESWPSDYRRGFMELWRVLEDYGVLIFKFNDNTLNFKKVLELFPVQPLFGNTISNAKSKTKWFCFMKIPTQESVTSGCKGLKRNQHPDSLELSKKGQTLSVKRTKPSPDLTSEEKYIVLKERGKL